MARISADIYSTVSIYIYDLYGVAGFELGTAASSVWCRPDDLTH
jgi:hypothetical protein